MRVKKYFKRISSLILALLFIGIPGKVFAVDNSEHGDIDNIKYILDYQYILMKNDNNELNFDFVNNDKLEEFIKLESEFKKMWYKKVGLSIESFDSNCSILSEDKVSDNNYILTVKYSVDLVYKDGEIGKSSDEIYKIDVTKDSNDKVISINDYYQIINNDSQSLSEDSDQVIENGTYIDIESRISNIKELIYNIDVYKQEFDEMENSDIDTRAISGYNRTKAVDYAKKWYSGFNSAWNNYGDDDCTNFVSQCVFTGGLPGSATWYNGSYAWINVRGFFFYMYDYGYASSNLSSTGAQVGDVIQLYNSGKATWSHSVIITGNNSSGFLYTSHSQPRLNYPLANVYPSSTYTSARYLKF